MDRGYILTHNFQPELVLLSFVLAFLGSYVALVASARIRPAPDSEAPHIGHVCVAALALGGVGIWGMHFVGMQAQWLPFQINYDVGLTFISFVVAVGFSGFSLWFVGSAPFSIGRCLVAGGLAGTGIASMHYIGIAGASMPVLDIQWQPHAVVASIAIAAVAATLAIWLAFNVKSTRLRVLSAVFMAAGICGMHYTATLAADLVCYSPPELSGAATWGGPGSFPGSYVASFLGVLGVLLLLLYMYGAAWRYGPREGGSDS